MQINMDAFSALMLRIFIVISLLNLVNCVGSTLKKPTCTHTSMQKEDVVSNLVNVKEISFNPDTMDKENVKDVDVTFCSEPRRPRVKITWSLNDREDDPGRATSMVLCLLITDMQTIDEDFTCYNLTYARTAASIKSKMQCWMDIASNKSSQVVVNIYVVVDGTLVRFYGETYFYPDDCAVPVQVKDQHPEQRRSCRPKCTSEYCTKHPRGICSAVDVAEFLQPCQTKCQHTSCSACKFVQQPSCRKCGRDDFRCMRKYGKCIRKDTCSRRKFPCKEKYFEDGTKQKGKFQCFVPEC